MAPGSQLAQNLGQRQQLAIGARQLLGVRLLTKSLPELREEVIREIEANPALEDIDHPLETPMSEVAGAENDQPGRDAEDGFPEEDFTPAARREDEEALERRQAMFDRVTASETLQAHLAAQIPLSNIAAADHALAELLIGELDAAGFFVGSLPDICMAFGKTEAEVDAVLAEIRRFDPAGCGSRTARQCLEAQLDAVPPPLRERVAYLVAHLEELADGRLAADFDPDALKALRDLDPRPGRAFVDERTRTEYVNPEIHAYRADDGVWRARLDRRSLPEIRVSPRIVAMLEDPKLSETDKAYLRERIAAAEDFREAIRHRQQTIANIANEIFARQQDFFRGGFAALKPLTEAQVADAVGVDRSTVSRTVRDKYADTPRGTIELRRFFTTSVKTASGEAVAQGAVFAALRELVAGEEKSAPLSDQALADALKARGFVVARRTVAKYREKCGIPGAAARRHP